MHLNHILKFHDQIYNFLKESILKERKESNTLADYLFSTSMHLIPTKSKKSNVNQMELIHMLSEKYKF
jgi:hypothetical protein